MVPLLAQEVSTVAGDWEIGVNPPRKGRIEGTLTGGSSGFFTGTLTEFRDGCEAQRKFSGQITLAGLNWAAGTMLVPCPANLLEFGELKLESTSLDETATVSDPEFHVLAVSLSGDGSGAVTSTPTGIDCNDGANADCSQRYREGTDVTLMATPAAGSNFREWRGACRGESQSVSVTIDGATGCTAIFELSEQPTAALTVTVSGTGSGIVVSDPSGIDCPSDCAASYTVGTVVTLTSMANSGSRFAGWSGACSGTAQASSVSMVAARTCGASFEPATDAGTNATVTGLTVSGLTGPLEVGGTAQLTATASYSDGAQGTVTESVNWTTSGSSVATVSGSGLVTAAAAGSTVITATYAEQSATVTVTVNAPTVTGLSVSAAESTLEVGAQTTVTATASYSNNTQGVVAANWSSSSTSVATVSVSGTNATVTAVAAGSAAITGTHGAHSASVTVTVNTSIRTLNVLKSGTGAGVVVSSPSGISCGSTCTHDYPTGTEVTLSADPSAGSIFSRWSGDCGGNASTVTFTMDTSRECKAIFDLPVFQRANATYVTFTSGTSIAGFQFTVTGVDVVGASGGAAAVNGFTINFSTGSGVVLGFSFAGNTIPAGEGLLVELNVEGSGNACLTNLVVAGVGGTALNATVKNCLHIEVP